MGPLAPWPCNAASTVSRSDRSASIPERSRSRAARNARSARWTARAVDRFESRGDLLDLVESAGAAFSALARRHEQRPVVGVVGEIYVRNNAFTNEDVIRTVEESGCEAWMAPVSEWILYTSLEELRKVGRPLRSFSEIVAFSKVYLKYRFFLRQEARFMAAAGDLLSDRHEPPIEEVIADGRRYLPYSTGGESILSLGRTVHFIRGGAALVVNASPFGCMAGTICAALFGRMEEELGVPVVNLFYDGHGDENRRLRSFLANIAPAAPSITPRASPSRRRRREPLRRAGSR